VILGLAGAVGAARAGAAPSSSTDEPRPATASLKMSAIRIPPLRFAIGRQVAWIRRRSADRLASAP
jgi:hypothetical protein